MDYVITNFVVWTFSCRTSVQYLLLETEFLTLSLISSHLSFSKGYEPWALLNLWDNSLELNMAPNPPSASFTPSSSASVSSSKSSQPSSWLYDIPSLENDGTNFQMWTFQIRMVLDVRGLISLVDGTEKNPDSTNVAALADWLSQDKEAWVQIMLTLKDEPLSGILYATMAEEIWKKVKWVVWRKRSANGCISNRWTLLWNPIQQLQNGTAAKCHVPESLCPKITQSATWQLASCNHDHHFTPILLFHPPNHPNVHCWQVGDRLYCFADPHWREILKGFSVYTSR